MCGDLPGSMASLTMRLMRCTNFFEAGLTVVEQETLVGRFGRRRSGLGQRLAMLRFLPFDGSSRRQKASDH